MRVGVNGWALPVALGVAAWACSGSLPHPRYSAQPSAALTAVPLPPPPARVETVPPSPAKGAVWVDGEWVQRRGRWAWVKGRWVIAPANATFSPWTVVRNAAGDVLYAPGTWRDESGRPIDPPKALEFAVVSAGPIVDAEGVTESTGRSLEVMPRVAAVTSDTAEGGVDGAWGGETMPEGGPDGGDADGGQAKEKLEGRPSRPPDAS